jgi:hypothetical protein
MPRKIRWQEEKMATITEDVVDAVGYLGPLKAFTLYQVLDDRGGWIKEWNLTSHFIPSKRRKASFRSIEDGQRACETIVREFAKWLTD